ncbi:hypothetical protein Poli38472_010100 [Pythium oligandrum]|uniref:Uncharacterized protein n=1 Tax=Pythium oligandrum TaxID=41045 RepID=A0A8K1C8V0_PYTOL|nr:hypothetical protein Poli38472_010100 [Pythium oligandrum]|eukprot:TMW58541.1 hypothetical protein Poli38472_010100 [Pythium oligandrum]
MLTSSTEILIRQLAIHKPGSSLDYRVMTTSGNASGPATDPSAPNGPTEPNEPEEPTNLKKAAAAAAGAAGGAGFGAGLWGLAVPVVNAIGFGANGIAAGSTAASMMSAAAVANGGGVAAGSTVAVMQSIGAVGLAMPIGLGIVGAGAVVGGTIVGLKAYFSKSKPDAVPEVGGEEQQEDEDKGSGELPWSLFEWPSAAPDFVQTRFATEELARKAYKNSSASAKKLVSPDMICVEGTV